MSNVALCLWSLHAPEIRRLPFRTSVPLFAHGFGRGLLFCIRKHLISRSSAMIGRAVCFYLAVFYHDEPNKKQVVGQDADHHLRLTSLSLQGLFTTVVTTIMVWLVVCVRKATPCTNSFGP